MRRSGNGEPTAVGSEQLVKVLQELLGFRWTRTVPLPVAISEAQKHVDLRQKEKKVTWRKKHSVINSSNHCVN